MKQIIHFMFSGPATESWEIKSMQGRTFKKEKHYSLSCKMEELNGGGHHCTDFYGRPSGYPCPSQPHVMHQSQLCCSHDYLSMVLRCSCIPSSCTDQDPRRNGSAQHFCLLAPFLQDQEAAEGIQELLEVIKILWMAAADHSCCKILFGVWVIPKPTGAVLGSSEMWNISLQHRTALGFGLSSHWVESFKLPNKCNFPLKIYLQYQWRPNKQLYWLEGEFGPMIGFWSWVMVANCTSCVL